MRKPGPQEAARLIAQLAGIRVGFAMRKRVFRDERCGAALKKEAADRVFVGIIALADLLKRSLEDVPDRKALAHMQIPQGIDVHATRLAQVLVRASRQPLPGLDHVWWSEYLGRPAAVHDCGLIN